MRTIDSIRVRLFSQSALLLVVAVISLVLLATEHAPAQGAPNDETAVRDLVARYAAARENEDPKAIRNLFVEDADQLVSSGEWRRGQDTLVAGMLASSRGNPGERTITVQSVRFLTERVAVADARYEIAASPNRPARRMWSTFVALRTQDAWKIAAIRNMLPAN